MNEETDVSLPEGWSKIQLAQIVSPRTVKVDPASIPDATFIGMEHVEPHSTRIIGFVIAGRMKSVANAFQSGDVLYGRLRPYLNKVARPDFEGLCSGEFIVLPESEAVSGRFLKHRLNAGDFVAFANSLDTGDRPRVDFRQVGTFSIALPPTAEQTRIADALDELLSDLDAGIASLERAKARLVLYRAAILKAAVEGDLTADWRAAHPEVEPADRLLERILEKRRRRWELSQLEKFAAHARTPPKNWHSKHRAPAEPNKSELPALPTGWCWATVEQLIVEPIVNGVSVRGATEPPGIASLRLDAMSESAFNYAARRYLPLNESEVDDLWIEEGDFFVSRGNGSKKRVGRGTLAQAPLMKVIFPDLMMRLRLCSELRTTQWLARIWNSPVVRAQIEAAAKTTAGIYKIAQPDVARIAIPLPPSDEQVALVEAIDHQFSTLAHLAADIDTRLASAAALRQSILREAFAGRLVPQDPDDEPAAVLLERIAAERGSRSERRGESRRRAGAVQSQGGDTGTRTDR